MRADRSSRRRESGIPRARVAVLGLITIAVYGSWFYSFGVLLDPIITDTGWSEPAVAGAFGSSSLVSGFGSLAGGWFLDRWGSRLVFLTAATLGGGALFLAASATSPAGFALGAAIGGGVLASLGFYHVTQTVAVRISPGSQDRAIAVLTIWGAFASVIYIPLTAWLVTQTDWRLTIRILAVSTAVSLLAGAIFTDTRSRRRDAPRLFSDVGGALRAASARRFLVSQALAGVSVGTILVYQVPAMTSAGLALAAASFWAGFRGFAQLGGRLPLMPLVRRLGVANTLRLAYTAIAFGSLALAFSGNVIMAAIYAVVAGFGIGAVSPLVGMHSKDVFGQDSLGTAMGLVSLVFLLANAVGPIGAAWVADATGSRAIPVAISAVVVGLGAVIVTPAD